MSNYSTEKEEDKKGGAVPPWMTGSAKVGSGLSSGGASQAGSMLARLGTMLAAPKAIVTATVLGGMALGMGVVSTIQEPKAPSLSQRFNKEKVQTGSASGLPGMDGARQSALNMAQSANSGFYGDPNASAQAPTPEGASDAPADTPSDPAIDAAGAGATEGGPEGSPLEMAAALTGKGEKKGMGGGKFGKLSSGLGGGGLAGGAGLSGGIGGSFKQPNLTNSRAGDARAFQGSNRATVARSKLAAKNAGKSALKGATAKRLDNMNRAMGSRTGSAETGAATHAAQWDAATPSGGAITGGGASGMSEGGQFSGEEGIGSGGPLDTNSSSTNSSANDVKDIDNAKNVSPYQDQLNMAKGMLMLSSAIITIIGIMCLKRNALAASVVGGAGAGALTAMMKVFLLIAMGLGAGAAAIGATIGSKYGQGQQGAIIAMGGTINAIAAGAAMIMPKGIPAWIMILAGVAGMAMPLMGGSGGKTADKSEISENG